MKIYSSNTNGIRVDIDAHGAALTLFSPRDRNAIVRDALVAAGQGWIREFLPKRFTPYVTRAPFTYPKMPVGLASAKLRGTAQKSIPPMPQWQRIINREFMGWDPWSSKAPPERLQQQWMQRNPNEYSKRKGIIAATLRMVTRERKRLKQDLRRWAKKRVHQEIVPNLIKDEIILPLVHTGTLRDTFSRGAAARAISTSSRSRLTITIPRGDRQAARVNTQLTRVPYWEFDFIRRRFRDALKDGIAGTARRYDAIAATAARARLDKVNARHSARQSAALARQAARVAAAPARAAAREANRAAARRRRSHDRFWARQEQRYD